MAWLKGYGNVSELGEFVMDLKGFTDKLETLPEKFGDFFKFLKKLGTAGVAAMEALEDESDEARPERPDRGDLHDPDREPDDGDPDESTVTI